MMPMRMRTLSDYRGRTIRLTEERLSHLLSHTEMRGLEPAVTETLKNPTLVIESRTDPSAELNYRFYLGTRVATNGFVLW